jgi:hypothetical protein
LRDLLEKEPKHPWDRAVGDLLMLLFLDGIIETQYKLRKWRTSYVVNEGQLEQYLVELWMKGINAQIPKETVRGRRARTEIKFSPMLVKVASQHICVHGGKRYRSLHLLEAYAQYIWLYRPSERELGSHAMHKGLGSGVY